MKNKINSVNNATCYKCGEKNVDAVGGNIHQCNQKSLDKKKSQPIEKCKHEWEINNSDFGLICKKCKGCKMGKYNRIFWRVYKDPSPLVSDKLKGKWIDSPYQNEIWEAENESNRNSK